MSMHNNIAVLFEDHSNNGLTHDYFAAILDSFKRTVEEKGYNISFLNCNRTRENYLTYLEQVKQKNYDGVVIACIDFNDKEVIELIESKIPIVTIDEEIENVISVKSDNTYGIKNLVDYLVEMGHRRIAYIHGDINYVTNVRLNGFREALKEHNIEVNEEYIRPSEYRDMKKAAYQTEQLLRLKNPPSCIMYSDDYAAIGGINVLRARGLEIAEDISITGYDGIDILAQYEPRLTTVYQDTKQIGRVAAEKLVEYIENPDNVTIDTTIIDTILEKGRTVGEEFF